MSWPFQFNFLESVGWLYILQFHRPSIRGIDLTEFIILNSNEAYVYT